MTAPVRQLAAVNRGNWKLRAGIWLALAVLLLQSGRAGAAESPSYLCTAEKIAGFSWTGQEWVVTDFATAQESYLLQPATPPDWLREVFDYGINYSVTPTDQSQPEFWCGQATHGGQPSPIISCGGAGHGFRMDVRTLRFMQNYGLGYLDGRDSNDTTPYLAIGTCKPVEE